MIEHINVGVINDAFKVAGSGKDYLDESDVVIYFVDIFGQKPSKNQLNIFRDSFDIKVAGKLIGVTLPNLIKVTQEMNQRIKSCQLISQKQSFFTSLDIRNRGFLQMEDMLSNKKTILPKLNNGIMHIIFREFDHDEDGRVSYVDFCYGLDM
ncbi:hypothetical protein EG68_06800 [Paragonimus skrjabini miyazakii]|uniref:EF-hand domain-containing protein n=1 Tax=Paragonimus skrjabini miyazakii TaxID=59628 RepID=A0A8S9YPU8_9TREM|nr:hypothetical protein EG68_06800 [Paragonimus skrjabini miyazakii]